MNVSDLFNLSGKMALVTGASRGIAESIAKLLAQSGAHVILSSRKLDTDFNAFQKTVDINIRGYLFIYLCHLSAEN